MIELRDGITQRTCHISRLLLYFISDALCVLTLLTLPFRFYVKGAFVGKSQTESAYKSNFTFLSHTTTQLSHAKGMGTPRSLRSLPATPTVYGTKSVLCQH